MRGLSTYEAFRAGLGFNSAATGRGSGERGLLDLKSFVTQRRAYLLEHAEIKKGVALGEAYRGLPSPRSS